MQRNYKTQQLKMHEHAKSGDGHIEYIRLFKESDFDNKQCKHVDFINIKPSSSIGYHSHKPQDEELYIFISGEGLVVLNDNEHNVFSGTTMLFKAQDKHAIINKSSTQDLECLVVKLSGRL